mgnify:CR=1 FL=1
MINEILLEIGLKMKRFFLSATMFVLALSIIGLVLRALVQIWVGIISPWAISTKNWLKTSQFTYEADSEEFIPTIATYLERQWSVTIGWAGVRMILDTIPYILVLILLIWVLGALLTKGMELHSGIEKKLKNLKLKQVHRNKS